MNAIDNELKHQLFQTILNLKTEDECEKFFEDILTIKELMDMTQRLQVAVLLSKGVNYEQIYKETGVSTATISRVSRCLNYGNGGYKNAIAALEKDDKQCK